MHQQEQLLCMIDRQRWVFMAKTLVEVLEEQGIVLKKSGVRFIAPCPFHGGGERTPPFTVYPNETYYCFVCEVWGDAVKYLVDKVGMAPDAAMDYVGVDYRQPKRKQVIKIRDKSRVWPFLYEVTEAYHKNLLQTKGALNYLYGRGLSHETIIKYKLGYTDGSVLNLQFVSDVKLAEEYGILNEKGYEILSHRITIPNIPESGMCDYIIGRTVINDKIRYLNIRTPRAIYGLVEAWASPILFVTEGHFDYLVLREWGYPSIVVGGTHMTSINVNVLRQRNIVIVPDNDAAGVAAGLSLKTKIGANSMILDYTSLDVKDIGEAAQKPGAKEEFAKLVKEQVTWPSYTLSPTLMKSFSTLSSMILSH